MTEIDKEITEQIDLSTLTPEEQMSYDRGEWVTRISEQGPNYVRYIWIQKIYV